MKFTFRVPIDGFVGRKVEIDTNTLMLPFEIRVHPRVGGKQWVAQIFWPTPDDGEADTSLGEYPDGLLKAWAYLENTAAHWGDEGYFNSKKFVGRSQEKAVRKAVKSGLRIYEEVLVAAARESFEACSSVSVP